MSSRGDPAAKLPRRLLRPLIGRESRAWRLVRSPRLRYRCFRDPVDCVIHALLVSRRRVRFLQIGSNDGVTNDPLWTFRRYGNWSGVLVEPAGPAFRRLRRNYGPWSHRFAFERAAVAAQDGVRPLHHLEASDANAPGYDQIASLDPAHVRRHAECVAAPGARILSTPVRCVTFGNLLAAHFERMPDLLHIDAEGSEGEILARAPLEGGGPDVLLYEHVHMPEEERRSLLDRLAAADYRTVRLAGDTLAVAGIALDSLPMVRSAWRVIGSESEDGGGPVHVPHLA